MAHRNQHESIAPEYQLAASGQLAIRTGERDWPPIRRPRPIEDSRATAKSQTTRNIERELYGHQMELPTFKNVIVEAVREHEDRTFFEQPTPPMPERAGTGGEDVELTPPSDADTVIEFPAPVAKAA